MVELNLHALYSGLTVGHTPIVLCMCQQQSGIRASYHSRWVLFFVLLLYYCMITYACCHVCMYVITFSNRNIFHGFTLVTNFFSITCHVENKGRSLVRYINSKINERAQCVCVCGGGCVCVVCGCVCVWCGVCGCVNGLRKKKNGDEGRKYERNSSLLNFDMLLPQ